MGRVKRIRARNVRVVPPWWAARRQLLLAGCVVALAGSAWAQQSRCADCHLANPSASAQRHLYEWDRSVHGGELVSCEQCHGGDPTTMDRRGAHVGILGSRNPASPVHRTRVAETCGRCHAGPLAAFQTSRHLELLRSGDPDVPSCLTCHGEVAAHLLSPQGLEAQCAQCHGPSGVAPRLSYPHDGRLMLEAVGDMRASLDAARRLIETVQSDGRRPEYEEAYRQAEVPLRQAVEAGHAFVFDELKERLALARQRIVVLIDDLVNP